MGLEDLVPDVKEGIEEFEQAKIQSAKIPAVYALFDVATGEPLYVGETQNLFQRITDHHLGPNEGDLRRRIENAPGLNIDTADGALWNQSEIRWIRVDGGRMKRQRIERAIENRLDPLFSSE